MGSADMDDHLDSGMDAQNHGYDNDNWADMAPYAQSPYEQSSVPECTSLGHFSDQGLSSEPLSRMPPQSTPLLENAQHLHQTHPVMQTNPSPMDQHQISMLDTAWPSQLTNPAPPPGPESYGTAVFASNEPLPTVPSAALVEYPSAPHEAPRNTPKIGDAFRQPILTEKVPRRTLSAEQKRAMCQFHEANPGTRQADIGARFGVERSTVSKVLRQRDQYIKREHYTGSSVKRTKGRYPEFDRTLSNYIRRQQQRGFVVSDEEIMEQARLLAHAKENREGLLGVLTGTWLQKLKQKHGISSYRLTRRASEANIPNSARMSMALPALNKETTPTTTLPMSPTSPYSPLSATRNRNASQGSREFGLVGEVTESRSAQSQDSAMGGIGASSMPASTVSPTTSYHFSPNPNPASFIVNHSLQVHSSNENVQYREKRSNTFPSLDINLMRTEKLIIGQDNERNITHTAVIHSASSSAVQSPVSTIDVAPFALDFDFISPPALQRTGSHSSEACMSSEMLAAGNAASNVAVDNCPPSPTTEEARQAAHILLTYIRTMSGNGQFDQGERLVVEQLSNKLRSQHYVRQQQVAQDMSPEFSTGGLARIPEGDVEMAASTRRTMEVN